MGRAAEKALARGRKSGTQTHFCADRFVHEITHTFFCKVWKFEGNMFSRSIIIEENVRGHLSGPCSQGYPRVALPHRLKVYKEVLGFLVIVSFLWIFKL